MHEREAASRVDRLRALRGRRWSARAIGGDVSRVAASFERIAKRRDSKLDAWAALVPASLRRGCRVDSGGESGGGVLKVRAPSASARFALDRWLRGGGAAKLRSAGVGRVVVR